MQGLCVETDAPLTLFSGFAKAVIKKHLGHLPGEIMVVHFDGMGPTWSQLVNRGIEKYPEATHGIISDADFTPVNGFDKRQLHKSCAKHMFTITSDGAASTARRMDWIYRNLPGAKVERRTHQTLIAAPMDPKVHGICPATARKKHRIFFPQKPTVSLRSIVCWQDSAGKPINQTLIDLVIQEHEGGYQDRTPGKQKRYIQWLLDDLKAIRSPEPQNS